MGVISRGSSVRLVRCCFFLGSEFDFDEVLVEEIVVTSTWGMAAADEKLDDEIIGVCNLCISKDLLVA